jgi:hypothetical protein
VRVLTRVGHLAQLQESSPWVCARSYLGIPQLGHGGGAVVAEGDVCMAQVPLALGVATRFEWARCVCPKDDGPCWKSEAPGKPCGVSRRNGEPAATDTTFTVGLPFATLMPNFTSTPLRVPRGSAIDEQLADITQHIERLVHRHLLETGKPR